VSSLTVVAVIALGNPMTAQASTDPVMVRDPASIQVPTTFAPGDVTSPLDRAVATLEQEFPDTYGGLSEDAAGHFVVSEVGSDPVLEARAHQLFDAIPSQFGVAVAGADQVLTFSIVDRSLAQLLELKANVLQLATSDVSLHINSVGLDELHNRVLVGTGTTDTTTSTISTQALDAAGQRLVADFGDGSMEFQQAPPTQLQANRYVDSAPFNAGDQLTMPTVFGNIGCTAGPGVHFSTGWHLVLTAGHCSFNAGTNFAGNLNAYNGSTLMGPFIASSVGSPTSTWYDTGLISASSSNVSWTATATRTYITGSATAVAGANACSEGSYGGERCAQIISTNETHLVTDPNLPGGGEMVGGLTRLGVPTLPGDSGGIVVENSIYGPLAVGTNVSTGSSASFSEDLTTALYLWSQAYGMPLAVNTVANP